MLTRSVVLERPVSFGVVDAELLDPFHDLALEYGNPENSRETEGPRLRLRGQYFFSPEGVLTDTGRYPRRDEVGLAVASVMDASQGWFTGSGLIDLDYTEGTVLPGGALLPPPAWHVDHPDKWDNLCMTFLSNVDPTFDVSGKLSGRDRRDYMTAMDKAIHDEPQIQSALGAVVGRGIKEGQLKVNSAKEYELFGMRNTNIHRPRTNERSEPVFRQALKIYGIPYDYQAES